MDILELFDRGGPLMWAILAASVAAVAVFIDRIWATRPAVVAPRSAFDALARHLEAGDVQRALQLCREAPNVLTRVIESGLKHRDSERAVVKEAMEETGRVEIGALEAGLSTLSTIAAIAPLLGLLGTVTGMIKVFRDVAGAQNPDIALLAHGIWEALLTTGAGLTVAIPTYVAYRFIEARIDNQARAVEEAALDVLELLHGPGDVRAEQGTDG
jgi:biopolymer transport protein ExbB